MINPIVLYLYMHSSTFRILLLLVFPFFSLEASSQDLQGEWIGYHKAAKSNISYPIGLKIYKEPDGSYKVTTHSVIPYKEKLDSIVVCPAKLSYKKNGTIVIKEIATDDQEGFGYQTMYLNHSLVNGEEILSGKYHDSQFRSLVGSIHFTKLQNRQPSIDE